MNYQTLVDALNDEEKNELRAYLDKKRDRSYDFVKDDSFKKLCDEYGTFINSFSTPIKVEVAGNAYYYAEVSDSLSMAVRFDYIENTATASNLTRNETVKEFTANKKEDWLDLASRIRKTAKELKVPQKTFINALRNAHIPNPIF